ncbi:MAG: hypothetical protein ABMA64_03015 [Myxococcota bacterium]
MSRSRVVPAWLVLLGGCGQEYDVLTKPPAVDPADVTECPFSPVEGTRFRRYDCNPVFSGTDEEWIDGGVGSIGFHVEEVLGHPFYQMWYATGRTDGAYGLGYAISADGTNWTPLPENPVHLSPGPNQWNADSMSGLTVVWDGGADEYVLAYQGVNFAQNDNGVGILSSPDGRDWTEERGGKPFIDLGQSLDGVDYCWPLALTWSVDQGYRGYITGGRSGLDDVCQVYAYGGPDIDHLVPDGDVVLKAGPQSYDQEGMASAAVVELDGTWYMFYVGIRRWVTDPNYPGWLFATDTTLNLATSVDGVTWEKSEDNPIEEISLVDDPFRIGNVGAQVVGSRIHLWIDDWYEEEGGSAVGYFLYEPFVDPW